MIYIEKSHQSCSLFCSALILFAVVILSRFQVPSFRHVPVVSGLNKHDKTALPWPICQVSAEQSKHKALISQHMTLTPERHRQKNGPAECELPTGRHPLPLPLTASLVPQFCLYSSLTYYFSPNKTAGFRGEPMDLRTIEQI